MKLTQLAMATALACGLLAGCQNSDPQLVENQLKSGIDVQYMDTSVRPQDDLYRFVNGKWLAETEIPGDKSAWGAFYRLRQESDEAVHKIIEHTAALQQLESGSDEQKIRDFYNAYMDEARLEELGYKPMQPVLDKIAKATTHKDVAVLLAKLNRFGISAVYGGSIFADAKDANKNTIYEGPSRLGLPDRDYYLKDEEKFVDIRNAYLNYVETLLAEAEIKDAKGAASRIMALETQLAEATWPRVKARNIDLMYNPHNQEELAKVAGGFDITAFHQAGNLGKQGQFILTQPSFLEDLGKMFTQVPVTTWKEYLKFVALNAYADNLSANFREAQFAFYGKKLRGLEKEEPRWQQAVAATNQVLGESLGKLYVAKHFKPEAKARMQELVSNLIKAYEVSIDELEWMSEETKLAAKEKLNKFTPKIGYPDKWKDYSALEIKQGELVANYMRYAAFSHDEELAKLGKPIDKSEWGMTPQTVNAYYNPLFNEIVFPAAILQPPFFDMEADDAVNYGGIGAVIGHEIGHGFDDQGAKFDGDGNLRNWWQETDLKEFQQRGEALVNQYNGYKPFDDASVNGKLTLGENIGDLGGLTVAYKAYQLSKQGKEGKVIDGFSDEQRFFIGYAQIWRGKLREEALRQRLLTDTHSPGVYRALGTVTNFTPFYEAFSVKPGDALYKKEEDRIKIW